MQKKYELVILLSAEVVDDAKDKFISKLEKTVKALGGKVTKTSEMGKKQLAYKINKQTEAVYLDLVLEMPTTEMVQLDKKLSVDKEILRHLLVTID